MKRTRIVRVDLDLVELRRRLATATLSDEDREHFGAAFDTLALLTQELERKRASLDRLRKLLFGPTTERSPASTPASPDVNGEPSSPSSVATSTSTSATEESAASSTSTPGVASSPTTPAPKRKGHGRLAASAYTGAVHRRCSHPTLKPGQACPLCAQGKLYELASQKIVRLHGAAPVTGEIIECDQLRCALCNEVFTALPPDNVGPDKYDDEARATVSLLKYGTGMPFARLARLQAATGIPLPASVQWKLCEGVALCAAPVHGVLVDRAAQGRLLYQDDTGAKILGQVRPRGSGPAPVPITKAGVAVLRVGADDPRPPGRTGTFTTGIVSVTGEHRVVLFLTGWRHAGENLADVLARRTPGMSAPIQMCDALSRNMPPALATILANCLAHGRREFVYLKGRFPDECQYVIDQLATVYHNDAIARREGMSDEARLAWHQERSAPVMEALALWMRTELEERRVEPNSSLGDAFAYMKNHWNALTLFLRVPGAPLDNTECERALKLAILHRKNALFFRTQHGACVADVLMTVIHTAALAKKNVMQYLVALLAHRDDVASRPEAWLPWTYEATLAQLSAPAAA